MAEQAKYLKNLKSESVVQQVINCLTDGMVSGELKPGDRLPSEPELAAQLGVARTSVREATKILAYLGVLESRRSEGTFVANGFQESMIDPMVYGVILNGARDFDSLMELRELIEVGIMRLAVKKENPEQLADIRLKLEDFEAAASGAAAKSCAASSRREKHSMDIKISDLLPDSGVTGLPGAADGDPKRVREAIKTGRSREHIDVHWRMYDMLASKNLDGLEEFIHSTYFLDVVKE